MFMTTEMIYKEKTDSQAQLTWSESEDQKAPTKATWV